MNRSKPLGFGSCPSFHLLSFKHRSPQLFAALPLGICISTLDCGQLRHSKPEVQRFGPRLVSIAIREGLGPQTWVGALPLQFLGNSLVQMKIVHGTCGLTFPATGARPRPHAEHGARARVRVGRGVSLHVANLSL
jgi:hypothetical protein